MYKDGIYEFFSAGQKDHFVVGRFRIEGGQIVYPSADDKKAIGDIFAPGPITDYTERNLHKYLNGRGGYSYLAFHAA